MDMDKTYLLDGPLVAEIEVCSADYILLADIEGEDTSRVCGRTTSEVVAKAWSMGEGHTVYTLPVDGELLAEGFQALEF